MANDNPTLDDRIKALPQELFNKIYDFTFTASASARIIEMRRENFGSGRFGRLKWTKEVPSKRFCDGQDTMALLLVDKASHDQFVKSLYGGGSIFVFLSPPTGRIWLHCLKAEYLDMVQDIRCCMQYACSGPFCVPVEFTYAPALEGRVRYDIKENVLGDLEEFEGVLLED